MTRVFRTGRLAAASPDEAALRVRELYPDAIRVVLMPSPEIHRPFECVAELRGDEEMNAVNIGLAFLAALAQRFLVRVAQELWDELWAWIFQIVAEAEQKWTESGTGAEKREWAVKTLMTMIETRAGQELPWIQRTVLRLFIGQVVDAVITTVNDELGHDWVDKVRQVERDLAAKLPIIE